MHLGLAIENSVIAAAVVTNGGEVVWQNSHPTKMVCPLFWRVAPPLLIWQVADNLAKLLVSARKIALLTSLVHEGLGLLASVDLNLKLVSNRSSEPRAGPRPL